MFTITVKDSAGHVKTHTFDDVVQEVNIGRGDSNDIVLPLGNVSHQHCRIRLSSGVFVALDLGSTNGTLVNGHKLDQAQVVGPNDAIQVGNFTLSLDAAPPAGLDAQRLPVALMRRGGIFTQMDTLAPQHVRVEAHVVGPCVSVHLTQRFEAPRRRCQSATYVLPMGRGDVLTGFQARLSDRLIDSRIQATSDASPFDFAQRRPGLLASSLGHLDTDEVVEVSVRYVCALRWHQGALRLSLPAALAPPPVNPRRGTEPGFLAEIHIHAPQWLRTLTSPSGLPFSFQCDPERMVATFARDRPGLDDEVALLMTPREAHQPAAWAARGAKGEEIAIVHFAPPVEPRARPVDVLFMLDCSDALLGEPFENAQRALSACLDTLGPQDTFNILWFGGHFASLWASGVPADASNKADAQQAIEKATPSMGGNDLASAIQQALSMSQQGRRSALVLLTSGGARDAERSLALCGHCRGHIQLAILGVHARANAHLLLDMAEVADGHAAFLDKGERPEDAAARVMGWVGGEPLTDVRVAWGAASVEQAPSACPPLRGGGHMVVLGKMHGATPSAVTVLASKRSWEVPVLPVVLPDNNPFSALWASATIHDLESRATAQRAASPDDRIMRLSVHHGVLSNQTELGTASNRPITLTRRWDRWSPEVHDARSEPERQQPVLTLDGPPPAAQRQAPVMTTGPLPRKAIADLGFKARLSYTDSGGEQRVVHISKDFPEVTLGRNPGSVIRVNNLTVSRAHARFLLIGNTFTLFDLNSSHGSFVNGQRITSQEIHPGDHIRCGDLDLSFEVDAMGRGEGLPALTDENPMLISPESQIDAHELKALLKKSWDQQREDAGRLKTAEAELERSRDEHRRLIVELHQAQSALRQGHDAHAIDNLQRDLALTRQERDSMGLLIDDLKRSIQRWDASQALAEQELQLDLDGGLFEDLDGSTTSLYSPAAGIQGDWLHLLLATQQPDGSFPRSDALLRWLGPHLDAIIDACQRHGDALVMTQVLISLLTTDVIERAADWGPAVERASAWLARQPVALDVNPLLGRPP